MSRDEWEDLGRKAGLDAALAGQCADVLIRRSWADRETALTALERLGERQARETLRNPAGMFVKILTAPGGPEPSAASIKRANQLDAKRLAHLRTMTAGQASALRARLLEAFPENEIACPEGWTPELFATNAKGRKARATLWDLWHKLAERTELVEVGA